MTHRIFKMTLGKVYPAYVVKAERKGRTKAEVDEIIRGQTGYSQKQLEKQIASGAVMEAFFASAGADQVRRLRCARGRG